MCIQGISVSVCIIVGLSVKTKPTVQDFVVLVYIWGSCENYIQIGSMQMHILQILWCRYPSTHPSLH